MKRVAHQPRRQRDRGHGASGARSPSPPSSTARRAACGWAWPTTAPASRRTTRDKLFVPHFSTKKRGSGLGLAIVSRIVQEHHGVIRVEEIRPHGARFVIELPAS